jgi:hypothetical protein
MIEQQTAINEILLRFDAAGALQGAHRVDLERVVNTDTGEVLAEKESGAQPVALADLAAHMDAALAGTTVQVMALIAERDAIAAERDALAARISELEAAQKDAS